METFPVPFVWDDQTVNTKRIILEIDGVRESYEIDEIEDKKHFTAKRKTYYVSVISTGYFRELEIRPKRKEDEKEEELAKGKAFMRELILISTSSQSGLNLAVNLLGVGVSIVDEEPKELMFLSVYKIGVSAINELKHIGGGVLENQEEYNLMVSHIQIDNMISKENPILFAPEDPLDKGKELSDPLYTPFIQLKLSQSSNQYQKTSQRKIDAFQLKIQAMKLDVETGTLKSILTNVTKITEVFAKDETEQRAVQPLNTQHKIEIDNMSAKKRSKNPAKKKSDNRIGEENQEINEFDKQVVCPDLNTDGPEQPDLTMIKTDKMYFRLIHFGAIKINVTFRFEKKALNFDINQGFGTLTILYTLLTTFANVSDAPLSFKELVIENVFETEMVILDKIIKNLVRQGIFQFYKLIGSSDVIGNPVGFVNKLGSGVVEFFSEPTKGFIKGPREFVGGVRKGVTSLVTGIFSASFDSASKISGS